VIASSLSNTTLFVYTQKQILLSAIIPLIQNGLHIPKKGEQGHDYHNQSTVWQMAITFVANSSI
jgi:hypothetical protein